MTELHYGKCRIYRLSLTNTRLLKSGYLGPLPLRFWSLFWFNLSPNFIEYSIKKLQ